MVFGDINMIGFSPESVTSHKNQLRKKLTILIVDDGKLDERMTFKTIKTIYRGDLGF
jgi:hypothetical protein